MKRELAELQDHLDHLSSAPTGGSHKSGNSNNQQPTMEEVKEGGSADGGMKAVPALAASKGGSLTARLLDAFGDLQATSARLHAMQAHKNTHTPRHAHTL